MRNVSLSVCSVCLLATAASAGVGVRLRGDAGARLEAMIANDLAKKDVVALTDAYRLSEPDGLWQTEFWGKFMHAAVPLAALSGNRELAAKVDAGVCAVIAAQGADGYLGNTAPTNRFSDASLDVWNLKYTLMGLLLYHEAHGDAESLGAATRLADCLLRSLPADGSRPMHRNGSCAGTMSLSVLEPMLFLYRLTKEPRYRDYAAYLVREMAADDGGEGPDLVEAALKGVSVCDRMSVWEISRRNRRKAYETMSCYQGLLDWYALTGERRPFDAALASAESIRATETTLAGSSSSREFWCRGATCQHLPHNRWQETCVTTTWMRLCERLLALTGDPKWADELERSFHNAYLAALAADGSCFVSYTPMNGGRTYGQDHCRMYTNCCNENGPRGFVSYLNAYAFSQGDSLTVNFYDGAAVERPVAGGTARFDVYSRYPAEGTVEIRCHGDRPLAFALRLRIPAWSEKTSVRVNGTEVAAGAGTYLELRRTWTNGDAVELDFDFSVKPHYLDHAVAFTAGPLLLARDPRFGDGPIGEVLRPELLNDAYERTFRPGGKRIGRFPFRRVRPPFAGPRVVYSAVLPLGAHTENPGTRPESEVKFCDFASAASDWTSSADCRTWFEIERTPWE